MKLNTFDYAGKQLTVLYDTVIVSKEGNIVTLNSGGYKTKTTKKYMNEALEEYGIYVFSKKGVWLVQKDDEVRMFHDGIRYTI